MKENHIPSDIEIKKIKSQLKSIDNFIINFKKTFTEKFQEQYDEIYKHNERAIQLNADSTIKPVELIYLLVFGESKYNDNINNKVDYNKNKNLLKNILFNYFGVSNSTNILRIVLKMFNGLLSTINDTFEEIWIYSSINGMVFDDIITKDEIERIMRLISAFMWESEHKIPELSALDKIIAGTIYNKEIKNLNQDTLKRFYFNDVYELKNNVKMFELNDMFFGETNSIMRMYNNIFNFIFGDIIGEYYIINNTFRTIVHKQEMKK